MLEFLEILVCTAYIYVLAATERTSSNMSNKVDIESLNSSFLSAREKHIWKKKSRFFHFITVENFIYHLPRLKDRAKRELAYNNLCEYLRIINEIDESEELDAKSGDELFSQYLQPLVNMYDHRLGFIVFIRLSTLLLIFCLFELIAYALQASIWIHMLIVSCFLSYFLYQLNKRKQRKVYGVFY